LKFPNNTHTNKEKVSIRRPQKVCDCYERKEKVTADLREIAAPTTFLARPWKRYNLEKCFNFNIAKKNFYFKNNLNYHF